LVSLALLVLFKVCIISINKKYPYMVSKKKSPFMGIVGVDFILKIYNIKNQ
jgi:hypothetical protein